MSHCSGPRYLNASQVEFDLKHAENICIFLRTFLKYKMSKILAFSGRFLIPRLSLSSEALPHYQIATLCKESTLTHITPSRNYNEPACQQSRYGTVQSLSLSLSLLRSLCERKCRFPGNHSEFCGFKVTPSCLHSDETPLATCQIPQMHVMLPIFECNKQTTDGFT